MEELVFIFVWIVLEVLLFWTGEAVVFAVTLGHHRPRWRLYDPKWRPHLESVHQLWVMALGLCFWVGLAILVWKILG